MVVEEEDEEKKMVAEEVEVNLDEGASEVGGDQR